ncbi:xylulokinase [Glutamicibacter nicotianae]|uniref:xylulokinase n=1 Tax=Glutamicibacter nicotianae TaxID=37929 RepID=UPI000EF8F5DA|nr:FGGY-family carbohydrate kinase [Glutamicibacter nicotianae]
MATAPQDATAAQLITSGQTVLGVELGSTNIKASLIGPDFQQLASGSHQWDNKFEDQLWTYSLDAIRTGLQQCFAAVLADCRQRYGVAPSSFASMGVSAMMHGYLAFGQDGELLVPFRTWRNTNTRVAAERLTGAFRVNIPLRWSVAHYFQAMIDGEEHVPQVRHLTTLAGYVHTLLTGEKVLGIGDASGMFPIDTATGTYDAAMLDAFDEISASYQATCTLAELLPAVLPAGAAAGNLSEAGARLLDPTGQLQPGTPFCPPEGDAGTGMVATNSVAVRTGNVSAGTSIFAMLVLERPLAGVHHEIDVVTTPAGDSVAMVHCNNGASEIGVWAGVFGEFAKALGVDASSDRIFEALLGSALDGQADGAGLLAYNNLSGEPVTGLEQGRPLVIRTPDSALTLANLMRAQVYGMFATLSLGMKVLAAQGVQVEKLNAHGGIFRTAGVAQRFLAAALDTEVSVSETAGHGGPWGIAVLASFRQFIEANPQASLDSYLDELVFAEANTKDAAPLPEDVVGYNAWLQNYESGLAIQRAAIAAL